MTKARLHITISEECRGVLKHYVGMRKLRGETITEGDLVEEALMQWGLFEKWTKETKEAQELYKKSKNA